MTRTEADIAATIAAAADDIVVDTDAFVTTVKRRHRWRRRRQLAIAGGATVVVAVGVGVPAALLGPLGSGGPVAAPTGGATTTAQAFAGTCTVEKIPTPLDVEPGLPVWLTATDPTGRYIVGTYGPAPAPDGITTSAGGQPVRWDNGVGRVLPVDVDNVKFVQVSSVNRHGWVVGAAYADFGEPAVAWISRDATSWEVLPPPVGYRAAYAAAINDRGDVVGMAFGANGSHPVVWSPDGEGGWTTRVIDAVTWNNLLAIDDDGVVTVFVTGRQPHRWHPDGKVSGPPPLDHLAWVEPIQVRGDWVVATASVPSEGSLGQTGMVLLRWNIRTGETSLIEATVESMWSGATVNARGDVAWAGTLRTHDGHEYALPNPPAAPRG
ncbi:MAG: hypothetical protein IRY85_15835, partial [Micromonosporaceae bacterium]|nr:hypothetical protein [Micromonosporaceae bacterium]